MNISHNTITISHSNIHSSHNNITQQHHMKNKEGKEESSKRGTTESEKKDEGVANKVEKEKPRKNVQKLDILVKCSSGLKICAG